MSVTIPLLTYTDQTITNSTPVKAIHISEPRSNVQLCLTTLDKHIGTRGSAAHGNVSHDYAGFMPPSLLSLIDSYIQQLNDLERQLNDDEIPAYAIAIWHGESNQVPSGWRLCDGTVGTPDLRSRIPVNWGTKHILSATGGSMAKNINLNSLLKAHTHTFSNCTFLCGGATGSYSRYTKYGTVYGDQWHWDWDNCTKAIRETSGSAGTGSSSSFSVTIQPPYVAKWYIQKQSTEKPEVETYMISFAETEHGSVTTNISGRVTKGSRLIISGVPDEGYYPAHIYVNGKEVTNDIIMYVYEDILISATFEPIPSGEYSWTSAGTYLWTVPAYVTKVEVALCGGGSGNCVMSLRYTRTNSSSPGGDSSFGNLISAQGAGAVTVGTRTTLSGAQWSTSSWGGGTVRWETPYARRGTAIAGDHVTAQNGATGWVASFTQTVGGTSSPGAGAYAYTGNPDYNNIAASGSSGLYNHGVVTVTPGQQITVTVGKGGTSYKYAPDTSYNSAAYSGYDGFVMIRYGSDIS